MIGGISDRLIIGFDMSGDDKACLTVARRRGRGYQVIKQFFDQDAEFLYEQLSDLRVMRQSRNITDFVNRYIEDLEDSISDYRDSLKCTRDKSRQREYAIMIKTLRKQVNSLRDLLKDYEEAR